MPGHVPIDDYQMLGTLLVEALHHSLPDTAGAEFHQGSWQVPPIFGVIQREGNVSDEEMYRVFNMGLGMVAVCDEESVATILDSIPDAEVVGSVIERDGPEQIRILRA